MNPIDQHVGDRLRRGRINRDLTQRALAQALGVPTQDIMDYEAGCKRISAVYLFMLTKVLYCDIAYFFEDLEYTAGKTSGPWPWVDKN